MTSRWLTRNPIREHLTRAGAPREISKLRSDVDAAFTSLETEFDAGSPAVADPAALVAIDVDGISAGVKRYVTCFKDFFIWDPDSTEADDGVTVLEVTGVVTGRWLRTLSLHPSWLTQGTWYVDSVSGDDTNSGSSSGEALATWAELVRRVGLEPYFPVSTTIHVLENLPGTDPMVLYPSLAPTARFKISGTFKDTAAYTGSFTSVTTRAAATNTPTSITDTAHGASWATELGHFLRITASATPTKVGAWAWVAKDLGGNACRTSTFQQEDDNQSFIGSLYEVTPAVGDAFETFEPADFVTVAKADIQVRVPLDWANYDEDAAIENIRFYQAAAGTFFMLKSNMQYGLCLRGCILDTGLYYMSGACLCTRCIT